VGKHNYLIAAMPEVERIDVDVVKLQDTMGRIRTYPSKIKGFSAGRAIRGDKGGQGQWRAGQGHQIQNRRNKGRVRKGQSERLDKSVSEKHGRWNRNNMDKVLNLPEPGGIVFDHSDPGTYPKVGDFIHVVGSGMSLTGRC
jgi:hypothetical protein